jgi:hypothetical protein
MTADEHLLNVLDNLVTLAKRRHGSMSAEVRSAAASLEALKIARTTPAEPPNPANGHAEEPDPKS